MTTPVLLLVRSVRCVAVECCV